MIKEKAMKMYDSYAEGFWDYGFEELKEFYELFDKEFLVTMLCNMHLSITDMKKSLDRTSKNFANLPEDNIKCTKKKN